MKFPNRTNSRRRHGLLATGVAALGMLAAAGCVGSGDDDSGSGGAGTAGVGSTPGDSGFESTVQPFINKACNCHQSTPVLMAPFSLKAGEAFANLVNKPAMQLPSMMLVKPGSLDESYLWHKINGTQLEVGGTGMIMPYTFPLTADEKKIFERWILAGAPP
jgi:hypothetical protein